MSLIELTLRQPAQLGDRARSDFVLATQEHIPGAVVRGALAAAWIARHGEPTPDHPDRALFLTLFEGGVRYAPLFHGEPVTSLSVLGHKYPATDNCDHDDYDEIDFLADGAPAVPGRCPTCGSPLEQKPGLCPPESPAARSGAVQVTRRTSVVMTSAGVASRGGLFTRARVEPRRKDGRQVTFAGHLVAEDPASLTALAELGSVRIGGRRTTHGLADVRIAADGRPPLPQRLDDHRIVLRLRSPGVFVDAEGRPTATPLHHLASWSGADATVEFSRYRWESVGGWHMASGLPKPGELAVSAGSTYVVRTSGRISDEALQGLADHGIGLRRHEGFGDLGPTAPLRPGRAARQAREQDVQRKASQVAALRGLATRPETWQRLISQLHQHAEGDAAATAALRVLAPKISDPVGPALTRLLDYSADDLRAVLEAWS